MAMCSVILTLAGGGLGLIAGIKLLSYPNFLLVSLLGAVLLPGAGRVLLNAKNRKR